MLWANKWRSLPQMPPVRTATRAHDGPGSVGSGSSTKDAGNPGSTMSNTTARTEASVGAAAPAGGPGDGQPVLPPRQVRHGWVDAWSR